MGLFSKVFGKRKEADFVSPMTGQILALEETPDPAFAEGAMGQGYAVALAGARVVAPFDGEVVACFPTGHAYGLRSDSGVEVLLHIGIDTVELDGVGFDRKVAPGQRVKCGDLLVVVDIAAIEARGKSLVSPVIFTGGQGVRLLKSGQSVQAGEKDILAFT